MSFEKFTKKMQEKAARATVKGQKSGATQINVLAPEALYLLIARIGRATETSTANVVLELLLINQGELEALAEKTESLAPKERLNLPLGKRRYNNLHNFNIRSIKKFAQETKGKNK